jgi:tRNA (cmo5U34)-methyltransferase
MDIFGEKARAWDQNPIHLERSKAIAASMVKQIPLEKSMKALEFGAGTGLLGFLLADKLGELVLMDTSSGMVEVIQEKVAGLKSLNVRPIVHDLTKVGFETDFDLVFSQMVFHHIPDIEGLLEQLFHSLKPGGYLAIADVLTEDGSFHGPGFDGHHGFDTEVLADQLRSKGFHAVKTEICYNMEKETSQGKKIFPVFLMVAKR